MSDYITSARKYRPASFETLVGQDNIARTLKNSITRGHLAHAYLFCGPRGVGKTSTARIFAKAINCANPSSDMEPCGQCESCISFQEGRSYCIHELDAASNNGVEDIKALMDKVQIPPQVGRYSVYIIDEVHMLSTSAFNAFLKTLEEPPAHAIFILATTEKQKIIPTILSRCQTYDFNRISIMDMVASLKTIAGKEGIRIDEESLHVIAQKADGAMRDALTLFDQTVAFCGTDVKYEDVIRNLNVLDREYGFRLIDAFLAKDQGTSLSTFDEVLAKGFNSLYFVSALSSHLRDLIVAKTAGLDALLDLPESLKSRYREQASRCTLKFLFDALTITTQCEMGYKAAVNQRLHIEFSLMKLCFLDGVPQETAEVASAPAAAPVTVPVPVAAPKPDSDIEMAVQKEPVHEKTDSGTPRPRRRNIAGGLSLSSIMESGENNAPITEEAHLQEDKLPNDDAIMDCWAQLIGEYEKMPRLATAMSRAKITITEEEGKKIVDFPVDNVSQKKWIEEKLRMDMEGKLSRLLGNRNILMNITVTPDTEVVAEKYMPAEKAQDMMEKNEEIRDLVIDLGLDIK